MFTDMSSRDWKECKDSNKMSLFLKKLEHFLIKIKSNILRKALIQHTFIYIV